MNFSFDITIDTIMAFIALVLAVYSTIYAWKANQFSIELSSTFKANNRNQTRVEFCVINTSSNPLVIKNIELFLEKEQVFDNGFSPIEYDEKILEDKAKQWEKENTQYIMGVRMNPLGINPYLLDNAYSANQVTSENFTHEVFLLPSQSESFSYYVSKIPNKIVVKTDKKIHHFKTFKSFFVDFQEYN